MVNLRKIEITLLEDRSSTVLYRNNSVLRIVIFMFLLFLITAAIGHLFDCQDA